MGILSESIFASMGRKRVKKAGRAPGLSCSQLFPCPYRLRLAHDGKLWGEEVDPVNLLNMDDGWVQEEKTVLRLQKAGIRVTNRQDVVSLGKSLVPGSIDGVVTLNGVSRLWEHKAWNSRSFFLFRNYGLKYFPNVKTQVNAYMLGMGLTEAFVNVIHKDSNDYEDIVVKRSDDYILPIIEWCDRIRIEDWKPEPKECEACQHCHINCFGVKVDFSWMKEVVADDMAEKWKQAQQYLLVGKMMNQEVRDYFVGKTDKFGTVLSEGLIGDKELMIVGDLEIKKVISHRFDVKKERVLEVFGPEGLMKVGEEKEIVSYRFKEVKANG